VASATLNDGCLVYSVVFTFCDVYTIFV